MAETTATKREIGDPMEALSHFFILATTQDHSAAKVAACMLLGLYNGYRFQFDLTELRRPDAIHRQQQLACGQFRNLGFGDPRQGRSAARIGGSGSGVDAVAGHGGGMAAAGRRSLPAYRQLGTGWPGGGRGDAGLGSAGARRGRERPCIRCGAGRGLCMPSGRGGRDRRHGRR